MFFEKRYKKKKKQFILYYYYENEKGSRESDTERIQCVKPGCVCEMTKLCVSGNVFKNSYRFVRVYIRICI